MMSYIVIAKSRIFILFLVLSALFPSVSILLGRNLGAEVVNSEVIINEFSRIVGVAMSAILLLAAMLGLGDFSTRVNKVSTILIALVTMHILVFFIGLFSNPIAYVLGDFYTMTAPLLFFMAGMMCVKNLDDVVFLLGAATYVGASVIMGELLYAVVWGGVLPIRYGSGLAVKILPVALVYLSIKNRFRTLAVMLCLLGVYVMASGSRLQFVIFVLVFLIFLACRGLVFSSSSRMNFVKPTVLLLAIFTIVSLVAKYEGIGVIDAQVVRWKGTLVNSEGRSAPLVTKESVVERLDNSLLGRVLEAYSAYVANRNIVVGNGLGATFENLRGDLVNDVNNHYIHTTPALFYLRMGVLGLGLWLIFLLSIVRESLRYVRVQHGVVSGLALVCLLESLGCFSAFFISSSVFFSTSNFLLLYFGALMALVGRSQVFKFVYKSKEAII